MLLIIVPVSIRWWGDEVPSGLWWGGPGQWHLDWYIQAYKQLFLTENYVKYSFIDFESALFWHALYVLYFLSRTSHMINLITWTIFAGNKDLWLLLVAVYISLMSLENPALSLQHLTRIWAFLRLCLIPCCLLRAPWRNAWAIVGIQQGSECVYILYAVGRKGTEYISLHFFSKQPLSNMRGQYV